MSSPKSTILAISSDQIPMYKDSAMRMATESDICCILESNNYQDDAYSKYDWIIAWGERDSVSISFDDKAAFSKLSAWKENKGWIFGYLSYDLKNSLENLSSQNPPLLSIPGLYFFQATHVLYSQSGKLIYHGEEEAANLAKELSERHKSTNQSALTPSFGRVRSHPDKEQYIQHLLSIKEHILDGDIYEMNYCRHFEMDADIPHAYALFDTLMKTSSSPFGAFFKTSDFQLFCGSPERFLCKRGQSIISQPIKGTIQRGKDSNEDAHLQQTLRNSIKDKAEHIMIVDLVRNDLSRTCIPGTVKVVEKYGIYPFKTVTQMISTVRGQLKSECKDVDAIAAAYPMGSMTGAPKVSAMRLIDKYEEFQRGVFSGSVGYFDEEGDFDFNVVIRSLLYNPKAKKAYLPVGGAIVYDSEAEAEYAESLLKAENLLNIIRSLSDTRTDSEH